jgi:hypothetical protein
MLGLLSPPIRCYGFVLLAVRINDGLYTFSGCRQGLWQRCVESEGELSMLRS